MPAFVFVGREREIARLRAWLNQALSGNGAVVFVSGEAGSGKSALVQELAHRAQAASSDLIVAYGECNAQTGLGDPYLPFREILAQLTGDVEGKLSRGSISQENASRLRTLLVRSGQVLVEVGPDLVESLVPGGKLIAQAGKALAEKVGWLDQLDRLVKRKREFAGASAGLDQTRLFDQFTAVLTTLAAQQPLLLLVDDLHWADAGSVSLLFHLARRIGDSRILILGGYRPEDVALGRGGERHPLDAVINELKRYGGDIVLDLAQAQAAEGRRFVDAVVDTEPNRLSYAFRQALFEHTGGHPLFTVELLRTMQARGDLVQDAQRRWVEARALDWTHLPTRVDGVIEERIGRLADELREVLRVGSIEGATFTAQVVAQIQAMRERHLLKQLSEHLDKRHRLVREGSETRVGRHILSRYQFVHALFQRYVYHDLSAGERRLLHGEVARVLEELYAGRTHEITIHLARHYTEAGDAAARVYGNDEARLHYTRALEALAGLPDTADTQRRQADVLIKLGEVLELVGDWPAAEDGYRRALPQAATTGDRLTQARCQRGLGALRVKQTQYAEALAWLGQARSGFEAPGDNGAVSQTLALIGQVHQAQGSYAEARTVLEAALALAREVGDRWSAAVSLEALGEVAHHQGDYAAARAWYEKGLALRQAIGDKYGIAWSLGSLGFVAAGQGDYTTARAQYEESLALQQAIGDNYGIAWSLKNLGLMAAGQGDYATARAQYEESLALAREMGHRAGIAWALHDLGALVARQGDYTTARARFEESLALFQALGEKLGIAFALGGLGLVAAGQGDYTTAGAQYEESVALRREIGAKSDIPWSLGSLAAVAAALGQAERAARLAGAGQALLDAQGAKQNPVDQALYDATVAALRAGLSAEEFAAAWAAGRAMTLEEAVAYALEVETQ